MYRPEDPNPDLVCMCGALCSGDGMVERNVFMRMKWLPPVDEYICLLCRMNLTTIPSLYIQKTEETDNR